MRADRVETPAAVPGFDAWGGHSRKTRLSSAVSHRCFLAAAMTALLPSAHVFAQQCTPPEPDAVSISLGNCSDPAGTTRESTGTPVVAASGTGAYEGTSIDLTANGNGGYGTYATGSGTITVSGTSAAPSTITTYGTGGHGAYATVGGAINLTSTDITTSGVGASAVFAAGGSITLTDSNTFSYGDNAPGAVASGTGSSLTLNNTFVNIYGNGSAGLLATGGGMITITGGAVAAGDYYGLISVTDSPGMVARGAGSRIQVSGGASSSTYGANSPGVWADAGGRIDFSGYGIFTYQPNSPGAMASGLDSTVTLTNTILRTSGPSSAGVLVNSAGTVIVTGGEVTTGYQVTGSNPPAFQFPIAQIGLEAHGADVVGGLLQTENARITTNGDGAIGVRVSQGGAASITGGTITTKGAETATIGGADGVRAQDAGSAIVLTRTAITTAGNAAAGIRASNAGGVQVTGGSVATTGNAAHGIAAINGGTVATSGTAVAVSGAGSAAIYVGGSTPSTVSVTGGSLSATNGAIVLAQGGTGTVSINGGTTITPALVNGRRLLAQVTEDAVNTPSNLTLNIAGIPSLTGDIVVDPSTLTYNLSNSSWVGNLVLTGPGNTASANLSASQWTGDLLADAGNTSDVALAQGSLWTGLARNATNVAIDASSAWNVTGDSNATGTVSNAGLIQFLARPGAYSTLTVGNYVGSAGSRIGFNTYLGADNSPTNLLVINGGQASGTTSVLVNNTGGPGALTTADGIRLVQVTGGGTTATDAFTLGQRVAAGAYEYQLFRGGSTDPDDWFLRSHLIDTPTPGGPSIPLYRPEVPLYAPIPAIARQMGLSTLGTLHERVGEEENLRGLPGSRADANGIWGRVFGERVNNRWNGTVDPGATGNLTGFQTGFDILRRTTDSGHRDHAGVYAAYTDFNSSSMRGFALGMRNLEVGRLLMNGPSAGAYWTHFGPTGWYVDGVFQGSWYDAKATSLYGAGLSTTATVYTASLEAGYPLRFGEGQAWLIEPQAQIVYQGVSVDRSQDQYSSVDWNAGTAWTGRLGARLQYTSRDDRGTLWQPYARINLWHAFSGTDSAFFGQSSPAIETRFGNTALEVGGGVTARVNQNVSLYGQASYRWSLDGGGSRQTATAGTFGIRFNW